MNLEKSYLWNGNEKSTFTQTHHSELYSFTTRWLACMLRPPWVTGQEADFQKLLSVKLYQMPFNCCHSPYTLPQLFLHHPPLDGMIQKHLLPWWYCYQHMLHAMFTWQCRPLLRLDHEYHSTCSHSRPAFSDLCSCWTMNIIQYAATVSQHFQVEPHQSWIHENYPAGVRLKLAMR